MMRGEQRHVDIFNTSFLDVLCCTVGALIFVLFIQTLRTRNMVERRELETTVMKLKEAKVDLENTEKAQKKLQEDYRRLQDDIAGARDAKEELETELQVAVARLEEIREELKEKDDTILKLVKELREPNLPVVAFVGLPREDPNAGRVTGQAMESQKTAHGQYLLGNLETRSIVCVADGFYLGVSRKTIPIRNNPDLVPLFRQFLRFHDPNQEGLWQTIWGDGTAAANASLEMRASQSASIGGGLIVHPEAFMEEAQQRATSDGVDVVALDTDGDGLDETSLEDADGDGELDLKRVNIDSDEFFEEVYLDYSKQRRQWARLLVDSDGDNAYDLLFQDTHPADSDYEIKYVLPNLQMGSAVFRYEDGDNDGIWDTKEENVDMTNPYWEKRYLLFRADARRWEAISVDTNGDGQADVLWRDTDMSNDDWEEKYVDENGDGKWDVYWKDLDPRDNDWEAKLTQPRGENGVWRQCELDTNASGTFDTMLTDTDGDGQWDQEQPIRDGEQTGNETGQSPQE